MANECLVTKLKGTVQNDNLPIINTLRLDLNAASERAGESISLLIGAGSKGLRVEGIIPFHAGVTTAPQITSYDILPNQLVVFAIVGSEVPTSEVKNAIIIKDAQGSVGGIYEMTAYCQYFAAGWLTMNGQNSGVKSLQYDNNLVTLQSDFYSEINPTAKCIIFPSNAASDIIDVDSVAPDNNVVEYLVTHADLFASSIVETITKYPHLRCLKMRYKGNINNLPLSIERLEEISSFTTGELADFASNRRLAGKTSGWFALSNATSFRGVTYNGTPLTQLPAGTIPMIDGYGFFYWDANNIGWMSSAPEGFESWGSPYWYTYYELNN